MNTMSGYTKLFSSILASTIWREDMETRIVWITLLAMAGKDGVAEASVPGLADFARVSVEGTRAALVKLMSPDEDSRSKEFEGRRIEAVDGGWLLLNHAKYRAKLGEIERREYKRLKQAHYREQQMSTVDKCGQRSPNVDTVDTIQKQKQIHKQKQVQDVPAVPAVDDGFDAFWQGYPKKVGKGDAAKIWRILRPSLDLQATITAAVSAQRSCRQWLKDDGQFIPNPATWLRQKRWDDTPDPEVKQHGAMPDYDSEWCQHDPRCNSRDWHAVLVEREART